jgi:hypothetical protein
MGESPRIPYTTVKALVRIGKRGDYIMRPDELASALRRIASGIENSKNPSRGMVEGDLKKIIGRLASFNPQEVIEMVEDYRRAAGYQNLKYDPLPNFPEQIRNKWPAELNGEGMEEACDYVAAALRKQAESYWNVQLEFRSNDTKERNAWSQAKRKLLGQEEAAPTAEAAPTSPKLPNPPVRLKFDYND